MLTYWADVWLQLCPSGASSVPRMGKQLTPLGQHQCPECARWCPKQKSKCSLDETGYGTTRFGRSWRERNCCRCVWIVWKWWYFGFQNDTSMILFCKETRKVSFFQVFINQRLDGKITAENDTMTLFFGKTLLSPIGHNGLHGHIVSWRVLTIWPCGR